MTETKSKIQELFEFDKKLSDTNTSKTNVLVIGTDEAGRGPGAGPVFAAAVCFCAEIDEEIFKKLKLLNDSKQLTEKKREELFENILELEKTGMCVCSVQAGSVEQIEKMNILNTSLDCMNRSCREVFTKLHSKPINAAAGSVKVLVDGNRVIKNFSLPQVTVVKGDSKSAAIAAASILAKVTRDRYMDELAKEFPQYHWEKNKGYLTSVHIDAIKEFGPTKWHRKKFLRKILGEEIPKKKISKKENLSAETEKDSQLSLF